MFKAFNGKKLTNNKQVILGSREKQHLLFSLVHLILCWAALRMGMSERSDDTGLHSRFYLATIYDN